MNLDKYISFNKYPKLTPAKVIKPHWINELPNFEKLENEVLAYGNGKSYGDVCLNESGTLVDTTSLNHIIKFDKNTGVITCETGVLLVDILNLIVKEGWFLPVTPGTKFITVGGALANDIHGKNHHSAGSFGNHVLSFELERSDGKVLNCTEEENEGFFKATIGGMGLTGFIRNVTFQCIPIETPFMEVENIKFKNLQEFFQINKESEEQFPYTVSWVDCTSKGKNLGRGIYMRGRHASKTLVSEKNKIKDTDKNVPFPLELKLINNLTVKTFNSLFYSKQLSKVNKQIVFYDPYFYPLDAIDGWNKAYGPSGFLQHQFVLPFENGEQYLEEIFNIIVDSGLSSFLTVLKTFGEIKSPGMLSFPMPGITMAIDYRMEGDKTLELLDRIDKIVVKSGGRLYPAKDARMSKEDFHKFYPNFEEFLKYKDPKFSSSFFRRVK